jgi:hypothetical protein
VASAYAQKAPDADTSSARYWGDAGLGGGSYAGGMAGIAFQAGPHQLFQLRAVYMEEFRLCIFGPCTSPVQYRAGLAGMFGQILKGRWGSISCAGGVAVTFVRTDDLAQGNDPVPHTTIGLPIELQAFVTPLPFAGIGITGLANINPKRAFAGAFLTLQVGKIR